jgi:serine phosphatase RsbU (regulator of sigma subunit)
MSIESSNTAICLVRRAPEIMRRWEMRVRAEIPASRAHQPLVLRNNFGQLLSEVARALSPTGEADELIQGLTLSEDHGSHRAGLAEYRIDAVFLEYRLLRQVIFEVLTEGSALAPAEREIITQDLDRAVEEAVSQFVHVLHTLERAAGDAARQATAELQGAFDRELRIAQVLQRPLLLKVAEDAVAGLALATFYEPARSEAEVGGDFFDVVPLAGGRVALVVGDTCGKGLEAAVHNTHVKDVLRAFLRESYWHPGSILSRLNQVVCDTLESGPDEESYRFVVLALLILDPASGDAHYSSAGAEPLLILRASGAPEVVECPALPLGIEREEIYADTPLHLMAGDTAVLLTDGITEARRGPALLGHEGMVELVCRSLSAATLQEAGAGILSGARAFAGGGLSDDACLILARRCP